MAKKQTPEELAWRAKNNAALVKILIKQPAAVKAERRKNGVRVHTKGDYVDVYGHPNHEPDYAARRRVILIARAIGLLVALAFLAYPLTR